MRHLVSRMRDGIGERAHGAPQWHGAPKKTLLLVRHGESTHNASGAGVASGDKGDDPTLYDAPLTKKGESQVAAAPPPAAPPPAAPARRARPPAAGPSAALSAAPQPSRPRHVPAPLPLRPLPHHVMPSSQVAKLAGHKELQKAELLLTSPLERALQTVEGAYPTLGSRQSLPLKVWPVVREHLTDSCDIGTGIKVSQPSP